MWDSMVTSYRIIESFYKVSVRFCRVLEGCVQNTARKSVGVASNSHKGAMSLQLTDVLQICKVQGLRLNK